MLYPSAADTTMSPLPFLATTATTVNIGMDVPIAKSVSPVTYENCVPSFVFSQVLCIIMLPFGKKSNV